MTSMSTDDLELAPNGREVKMMIAGQAADHPAKKQLLVL